MTNSSMYKRYRFPAVIIQYAVWLYFRFNLSHRDIEDLLAQRGIIVIDEVFVRIVGLQHYLWRAVDQDGEIVDVFLQKRRNAKAAKRFFRRLLSKHKGEPRKIVTDKLRSYDVAHRELIPESIHANDQYANNRSELSYQPTRVRERCMRKFKSVKQAQRFLSIHAVVYNLFILGRHLVSTETYRFLRARSFTSWERAAMV